MQFEAYQIIVPLLSVMLIAGLYIRFVRGKTSWQEALTGTVFWVAVMVFALFPDFFSNLIARFFGIKSNINAVIFFCLGLIFFFQYKLFFMIKKQQEALTRLTRDRALQDVKEKNPS